jgi:hypothetical protein
MASLPITLQLRKVPTLLMAFRIFPHWEMAVTSVHVVVVVVVVVVDVSLPVLFFVVGDGLADEPLGNPGKPGKGKGNGHGKLGQVGK